MNASSTAIIPQTELPVWKKENIDGRLYKTKNGEKFAVWVKPHLSTYGYWRKMKAFRIYNAMNCHQY